MSATNWNITIYNPDGSVHATGTKDFSGPGVGNSVTVPSHKYSCDHHHTLTGNQNGTSTMGGNGVNPWPDPVKAAAEESQEILDPPSWDASSGGPIPPK
jgi:hypothetical protein